MGARERSRWASAAIFKMALAETGVDLGRPLASNRARRARSQDEEKNDEDNGAFHRN